MRVQHALMPTHPSPLVDFLFLPPCCPHASTSSLSPSFLLSMHLLDMPKGKTKKRPHELYDHEEQAIVSEVLTLDSRHRAHKRVDHIAPTPVLPTDPSEASPSVDLLEQEFFETPEVAQVPEPGLSGIQVVPAKHYKNSDVPLSTWRQYMTEYLDEVLRLDGRGDVGSEGASQMESACGLCGDMGQAFRCKDCHGGQLLCQPCLKCVHRALLLHVVEWWSDGRFQQVRLSDLGLRVQVGHPSSQPCPAREAGHKDFVVLHTNGIHLVNVDFCRCPDSTPSRTQLLRASWWPATPRAPQTCATMACLRQFHSLNLQGKMSAYDYYKSLELLTNGAGLLKLPDRLPMLMLMMRQWRFIKLLKRAGRGLDPSGIDGTKSGELIVQCPACPRPGVNLPSNWQDAPPETAFLYWLVLAMDANFRLKSRLHSSEERDPSLGSGFAYFVESRSYGEYVLQHTSEDEISTCMAFAALATANLKRSTGLAATGVGAVTCGRHQFWRPNSIGDLQKGERYINMDYIFLSTLAGAIVKTLVSSYDLVCQWEKKFWPRVSNFPSDMQQLLAQADVIFLVPEFHLQAHEESCHSKYSSRRTVGMGRSELEGPERNWAWLNGAATSTKEMGPGSRRDMLDDFCGFSNWRRVVGMGAFLLRKMLEAIPNAVDHRYTFDQMVARFCERRPEDLEAWEVMFAKWDADKKKSPSPFATPRTKKTLAQIKRELKDEEQAALGAAGEVEDDTSPSSFLLLGIEIEHAQRVLMSEIRATKSPTTLQLSDFDTRHCALRRKIRRFRRQQAHHMPGTQATGADEGGEGAAAAADQAQVEEAELKMPSDFEGAEERQAVCPPALGAVETRLHIAEAQDALEGLRRHLRMRTFFNAFKVKNIVGQCPNTRARQTQTRIDDRVKLYKLRYQHAHRALMHLTGGGAWTSNLCKLHDKDIRSLHEDLLDVVTLPEDGEETDPDLQEALRVEWAKSKVCAARWHEEVQHVEEEMRRVLETFATEALLWEDRSARRDAALDGEGNIDESGNPALKEGLHVYAAQQAAMYRDLAAQFSESWAAELDEIGMDPDAAEDETGSAPPVPATTPHEGEDTNEEAERAVRVPPPSRTLPLQLIASPSDVPPPALDAALVQEAHNVLEADSHCVHRDLAARSQTDTSTAAKYDAIVRNYSQWWCGYQADLLAQRRIQVALPAFPITATKVTFFLEHETTREKRKQGSKESIPGSSLGKSHIAGVISALEHRHFSDEYLYRDVPEAKRGLHLDKRIKDFEQFSCHNEPKRTHTVNALKASGTSSDAYMLAELQQCMFWCVSESKTSRELFHGVRDRAMLLVSAGTAFRGDSARMVQWSDLFISEVPLQEVRPDYLLPVLGVYSDNAKHNQQGRVDEFGMIRHRIVELCPIGAAALLFWAHFHVLECPPPDFVPDFTDKNFGQFGRRDWYSCHLFYGTKVNKAMSYDNHYDCIKQIHEVCMILLTKVTHTTCHFGAQNARNHGASMNGAKAMGGWSDSGSYRACYDCTFPLDALLASAMFNGRDPSSYFLARDTLAAPSHVHFPT
ncbi:hypothetical protein EWM64_g4743 [Hericium alpestre]|uniref:CxC2-like cysteine cluster KDZ transposase-associated domain-containing protein n=1 Tax=Hericium alpestre TaxID=135208 RepID=A0A4Z0A0F4_9AGAM|nr:hypothetical protein EWM64_g4743 [Hericium alpestre]